MTMQRHLPHLAAALLMLAGTLATQAAGPTLTPVPERPAAPAFELEDLDGKMHRLSDYRGKVVIVNFWATWCPPCRREMPSMERAWKELDHERFAMLGVNVGEDADTIFPFTAEYPVSFPLLLDRDSAVVQQWPVMGLPTTFILDPQGRIAYRAVGGREWDDPALLKKIRALAGAP